MHDRVHTFQDFWDQISRVRMVKCSHRELELVRIPDEAFEIWDGVAMRVDKDLPTKYGGESFPLEVLWQIGSHACIPNVVCSSTPIVLGFLELSSFFKSMSEVPVSGKTNATRNFL